MNLLYPSFHKIFVLKNNKSQSIKSHNQKELYFTTEIQSHNLYFVVGFALKS